MARMLLVLVLIGAVAGQASGQAALPPFDATRFYDQARFDAAIVPYTQAIARNANDARAHYWLGVAYLYGARLYRFGLAPFAAGHAARAVAALERAVQLQVGQHWRSPDGGCEDARLPSYPKRGPDGLVGERLSAGGRSQDRHNR